VQGGGGGGGDGKNIGLILAGIALVAAGVFLIIASKGTGSPLGNALISIGVGLALSGVVGLVNAVPRPKQIEEAKEGPDRFQIQSTRNRFEPYGVVPKVFGTTRTYPKAGAVPYTEVANGDQYLRQVFVVGYGPLDISSIQIGETSIDDFADVQYETREGLAGDAALTLYSRDVSEQPLSILVDNASGWITRTTDPDIDEISVDLTAQAGIGKFQKDGDFKGVYVAIDIQYSPVGAGTWSVIPSALTVSLNIKGATQANPCVVTVTQSKNIMFAGDVVDIAGVNGMTQLNQTGITITSISSSGGVNSIVLDLDSSAYSAYTSSGKISTQRGEIFSGKTTTAVRKNKSWSVTNGQYDVRIKRLTPDTTNLNSTDKIHWTALRTFTNVPPIDQTGLALIAVRIRATEELNGIIDELSCIASAKVQVYDGASWALAASNNPAWAFVDVLTGAGNDAALALTRIDADGLKTWADNCTAAGREFNYTVNDELTIREMLGLITAAGRASLHIKDSLYSVVEDKSQTICRQHFSPLNSWGFESERLFIELPHAIRVEFLDEENGYKQETQIVYRTGYSASNATLFESKTWEGITNSTQIWKETIFHLASLETRPERFMIKTDIENIVCTRGDWVRLSAPAALIGVSYGRIAAVGISGTDVMRQANTTPIDRPVNTVAGDNLVLTFTTPIPGTEDQPQVGDLVLFGEATLESIDCIIQSISHFDGVHATLTLVDRADSIHLADQGVPPVWLSHITLPVNPTGQILPVPIINHIDSTENLLVRGGDGSLLPRMSVQVGLGSGPFGIVTHYQARHRLQDDEEGSGPWMLSQFYPAQLGDILINGVLEGQVYDVQARSTNGVGAVSDWSAIIPHTIIGKSNPPPDVTTFLVSRLADGTRRFEWTADTVPLDFDGFVIKFKTGTGHVWADLAPLHTGRLYASPFETNQLAKGDYVFGIKMVDTSGNESENALIIEGTLDNPRLAGALFQVSARSAGWPGTKTDCEVVTNGNLVAQDNTTTWASLVSAGTTWANWTQWALVPEDPIFYEHIVIDLEGVVTFTPLVTFTGTGTETITEAHSDDDVTYTSFAAISGQITARYIKIKCSVSHALAIMEDVEIIIDAEIIVEDLQDVDMSTLSGVGVGDRTLALNKTFSLISSVTVILQNVGPGYTWELIDKSTSGPRFKVHDETSTPSTPSLADVTIDAVVRGIA
jgi:hypothetical protein